MYKKGWYVDFCEIDSPAKSMFSRTLGDSKFIVRGVVYNYFSTLPPFETSAATAWGTSASIP